MTNTNQNILPDTTNDYPLEWFDSLITVALDPENLETKKIEPTTHHTVKDRLKEEDAKLQLQIKSQVFKLNDDQSIEVLVRHYHSSLITLLDQTLENKRNLGEGMQPVAEIYNVTIDCLEGLLSFIETRFSNYLSPDERIPPSYLLVVKDDIKRKLQSIMQKITGAKESKAVIDLVIKRLHSFLVNTNHHLQMTFKTALYKKELVGKLDKVKWDVDEKRPYSPVDEILIYMNFNSKSYIRLLTGNLTKMLEQCNGDIEKLDKLLYFYKEFKQIHREPDMVLNPKFDNVETVLENWFSQEILYLEKRIQMPQPPVPKELSDTKEDDETGVLDKVTLMLSSDQIGLILRGADEARVILAKSMSDVFRKVVKHLSTPRKKDLSYSAMRSKVYSVEDRDKQLAIEALQKIIKKISEY